MLYNPCIDAASNERGANNVMFFLLMIAVSLTGASQPGLQTESVAESHIRANVPDEKNFDAFLKRDLEAFFKAELGKAVTVQFELLRKGPTQAGVALPKYYIWVKVYQRTRLLEEGAARVAAAEKKQFDVVQYMTRDEIKQNPEKMYQIFPLVVGEKIMEKINQ